jgi:peroxiredoxin
MRVLDSEDEQRRVANFTLTDLDGKEWTLRALRGKVVVVNLWATWCPPCRKEIPTLKLIYDRFKSRGLVILAISEEEPEILRKFVSDENVNFPVLPDGGKKIGGQVFHVTGVPVSFIYNRSGRLVAQAMFMPTKERLLDKLSQAGLR